MTSYVKHILVCLAKSVNWARVFVGPELTGRPRGAAPLVRHNWLKSWLEPMPCPVGVRANQMDLSDGQAVNEAAYLPDATGGHVVAQLGVYRWKYYGNLRVS